MILPPTTLPLCQFRHCLSSKAQSEFTIGKREPKGIHNVLCSWDGNSATDLFVRASAPCPDRVGACCSFVAIDDGTRGGRRVSAARPIRARFILLPGDRSAGRTVRVPSPRSVRGRGPHRRAPGERMRSGRDVTPFFRTAAFKQTEAKVAARCGTLVQSRRRGQGGKERGKPDEDCHPGSGAGSDKAPDAPESTCQRPA